MRPTYPNTGLGRAKSHQRRALRERRAEYSRSLPRSFAALHSRHAAPPRSELRSPPCAVYRARRRDADRDPARCR